MIKSKTNRVRKFISYLFLILFLSYYGSVTLFYHSHLILGDTIIHSHPFQSDDDGKPLHSHSGKEYITIQFLSCIILSSVALYLTFRAFDHFMRELFTETQEGYSNHSFLHLYSLRAPPALLLN